VTTRRKRGKPARWPWRSRLDMFLFFRPLGFPGFFFSSCFSGAFLALFYLVTPAPQHHSPPPTSPSTCPSLPPPSKHPAHQHHSPPLPLSRTSPTSTFSTAAPTFFFPPPWFFSFSGAFTTAEISRKDAQHTPAPSPAPATTSSSASGPVNARLALLSLHGWTVSLHRILILGYLGGSGGKKWALA